MFYRPKQDRTLKRQVQDQIYSQVPLHKMKGIYGLLGPDVFYKEERRKMFRLWRRHQVKRFISFEVKPQVVRRQALKLPEICRQFPVTICYADLLYAEILPNYFYDIDLCCKVDSLDDRIKRFSVLPYYSITLSCPHMFNYAEITAAKTVRKFIELVDGKEIRNKMVFGGKGNPTGKIVLDDYETSKAQYNFFKYRRSPEGLHTGSPMIMVSILRIKK